MSYVLQISTNKQGKKQFLPWRHCDIFGWIMNPKKCSAFHRRPNRGLGGLASVVGHVSRRDEMTSGPAIKVELENRLDMMQKICNRVRGSNVGP